MKNQSSTVAVYCRVSTDEQAESGSIQNQIEFARRYCDLHGLRIFDVYADDGVSGTIPLAERPEGARQPVILAPSSFTASTGSPVASSSYSTPTRRSRMPASALAR